MSAAGPLFSQLTSTLRAKALSKFLSGLSSSYVRRDIPVRSSSEVSRPRPELGSRFLRPVPGWAPIEQNLVRPDPVPARLHRISRWGPLACGLSIPFRFPPGAIDLAPSRHKHTPGRPSAQMHRTLRLRPDSESSKRPTSSGSPRWRLRKRPKFGPSSGNSQRDDWQPRRSRPRCRYMGSVGRVCRPLGWKRPTGRNQASTSRLYRSQQAATEWSIHACPRFFRAPGWTTTLHPAATPISPG